MRSDVARLELAPAASREPPELLLPSLAAVARPAIGVLRVAEAECSWVAGERDLRTSKVSTRSCSFGSSGELDKTLATASEPLYAAPGAAAPALVPEVDQASDEAESAIARRRWEGRAPTADNLFAGSTV